MSGAEPPGTVSVGRERSGGAGSARGDGPSTGRSGAGTAPPEPSAGRGGAGTAPPGSSTGANDRFAGRKGRAVGLVALAVAVAVAVLVVVLAAGDPQRGALIGRSAVGKPAPPISGLTLAGDFFDLDDHRGRWVVVNFFATWCTGCIIEHPELVAFSERHAAGDAVVVTVAFDDSPEAVRGFFARAGGDWPVLAGDVGSVPVDYGVTAVPETYLVSPAGYVVDKLVGATGVTAEQLDARIAALEALADPAGEAP